MKVTNWEAAFRELAAAVDENPGFIESLPAKHTSEVPDGRTTHMLRALRMADVLCDVTEEEAAALDARPAQVAQLEAELKAESDRGDKLGACLTRERAIAMRRELLLTDALTLLDRLFDALREQSTPWANQQADRIMAFMNRPDSIPEPTPDPRDAFVCFAIEPFASGELPADQAEVFRQHLPECATCRKGLADALHQAAIIAGKEDRRG